MRTRNAAAQKTPAPPPKKTPVTRKSAVKTPPAATTLPSTAELITPGSDAPLASTPDSTPATLPPPVEQEKVSTEGSAPIEGEAAPKKKVKKTRKVIRKVLRPKIPASAESAGSTAVAEVVEAGDGKDDQGKKGDIVTDTKDDEHCIKGEETSSSVAGCEAAADVHETKDVEEDKGQKDERMTDAKDVEDDKCQKDESMTDAKDVEDDKGQKDESMTDAKDNEQSIKDEEVVQKAMESEELVGVGTQTAGEFGDSSEKNVDDISTADAMMTSKTESPVTEVVMKSVEVSKESIEVQEEVGCDKPNEEVGAGTRTLESEKLTQDQVDNMDDDKNRENMEHNQESENINDSHLDKAEEASQLKESPFSEARGDCGVEERFVEPVEDNLQEDDEPETTDDSKALTDENKELAAASKDRKVNKEHEIFVSGLDSDVVEDDIKKAFEKVGEVVEVRLLKDPSTNKSRGFAFVRFDTRDQAKKAVSEMKNPIICGKQCGTALNEGNDTLFVGNICNTWTQESINQKLKDFNLEGVEIITLVQDPRREGLSRGFCFIQFACHTDAMSAYQKLQKSDAVFGHTERSVKVAFAEPLPEPDPEVMAKVKSVFIDGILPSWDEDCIRNHFKGYGDIQRITLARNMSSSKRKDFGFVDYSTHEAALACIEEVNKKDLVDGNLKIKVRARLANPLPRMQAVKGGMRGGLRIGRPAGRGKGHPGPLVNRSNFQHGRMSHAPFNNPIGPYEAQRVPHRRDRGAPIANIGRPSISGPRHIPQHREPFPLIERGPTRPIPQHREPFPLNDGGYWRPLTGSTYDEPYMHGVRTESHGLKRPFYMTEPNPTYMEPGPVRARYDYTAAGRGTHLRDTYGAGSSMYSSGYVGPDYGARPHSSFNVQDRSYDNGRGGGPGRGRGTGYYY